MCKYICMYIPSVHLLYSTFFVPTHFVSTTLSNKHKIFNTRWIILFHIFSFTNATHVLPVHLLENISNSSDKKKEG
jgi:hypothetical protein